MVLSTPITAGWKAERQISTVRAPKRYSVEPEGAVALQQIAGGAYAVTRHVGPYGGFPQTYARLFGEWLPRSGRDARSAPAPEFYRNAPMNTAPQDLITDIYIPLED